jgi:hypothetical protein
LLKLALNTIKRNTKMREECDNKGSNFWLPLEVIVTRES